MGKKKKLLILIGVLLLIGLLALTVKIIEYNKEKNKIAEEELVLFWESNEIILNAGEVRVIKWGSNRDVNPYVFNEGNAISILDVTGKEIKIKAVEGGYDVITLQAENQSIVCVITVNGDLFSFEAEEAILPAGVSEIFFIKAQPEELLEMNRITYMVEDRELAVIKQADNEKIEVLGLKKGITYINAEWRGKRTGFLLEVIDDVYRNVIVPKEKQYIFAGQETSIRVGLEDFSRGDEYNFKYMLEPNKDNIAISFENNLLTVKAVREGEQYVRVSHPKAKGAKNIYFDVLPKGESEPPRIETSESPMILRKDERRYLLMYVFNGEERDKNNFNYRIVENQYAVEISQSTDRLLVRGAAPGAAKVRISNPAVTREYDVIIIVE